MLLQIAVVVAMAPRVAECVKHGETDDNGVNGRLKKDYSRNTAVIGG